MRGCKLRRTWVIPQPNQASISTTNTRETAVVNQYLVPPMPPGRFYCALSLDGFHRAAVQLGAF
jgi:hypothetical protein